MIQVTALAGHTDHTKHPVQGIRPIADKNRIAGHDLHQISADAIGVDFTVDIVTQLINPGQTRSHRIIDPGRRTCTAIAFGCKCGRHL